MNTPSNFLRAEQHARVRELENVNRDLAEENCRLARENAQNRVSLRELNQALRDLRDAIDSTELAAVFVGGDMRIRSMTPAAQDVLLLGPEDIGRSVAELGEHVSDETLGDDVRRVIEGAKRREQTLFLSEANGWLIRRVLPNRNPAEVQGCVITYQDVTALKRTELALQEADRRKDEFLATLSHELRNPLAPVKTALHLLQQPNATGLQAERARLIIARQVDHLARLVDDLLELSRISRGRIELIKSCLDINQLVRATVDVALCWCSRGWCSRRPMQTIRSL